MALLYRYEMKWEKLNFFRFRLANQPFPYSYAYRDGNLWIQP